MREIRERSGTRVHFAHVENGVCLLLVGVAVCSLALARLFVFEVHRTWAARAVMSRYIEVLQGFLASSENSPLCHVVAVSALNVSVHPAVGVNRRAKGSCVTCACGESVSPLLRSYDPLQWAKASQARPCRSALAQGHTVNQAVDAASWLGLSK